MKGQVGATIVVESERTTQTGRQGVIEEVLREDPPRYRVRWEDGRESIFSPAAGVARIKPKRPTTKKPAARAARSKKPGPPAA